MSWTRSAAAVLVFGSGDGCNYSEEGAFVPLTMAETAKVRRMVCWRATRTSDWRCGKRWVSWAVARARFLQRIAYRGPHKRLGEHDGGCGLVVEWTAGDRCDSTASPPSLKRRSSFPVVELAVGRVRGRPYIVAVKRSARDISLGRPSASVSNHSSPSHFIPLTPPSNHPRQPLITTRSACRRPRSTHPTQHCTGDH